MPRPELYQKRLRFGLVLDWLGTEYHQRLLEAASDFCRARGIGLVSFLTGRIGSALDSERCRNTVLGFAGNIHLDGLVVAAASIGNLTGIASLADRFNGLVSTPLVSIGAPLGTWPWVATAEAEGIGRLMDHLIKDHGFRRFAYILGSAGNPENERRYALFRRALAEANLSFDELLAFRGDFRTASGHEAGLFFQRMRHRWDVVVSANDLMAIGARHVLGDRAPITGFDNIEASARCGLTTIDPEPYGQAVAAFETLARMACGQPPNTISPSLQSRFVRRASCGCPAEAGLAPPSVASLDPIVWMERTTDFGEALVASNDRAELEDRLRTRLPGEGIRRWSIIESDNPDGMPAVPTLPALFEHETEPLEILVQALFADNEDLGYCLLDMAGRDWLHLEWLRRQISLAMLGWRRREAGLRERNALRQNASDIAERERGLRETIGSLPLWIVELDRSLRIRYCNKGFGMLAGVDPSGVIGRPFGTLVMPDDWPWLANRLHAAPQAPDSTQAEFRLVPADGHRQPLACGIQRLGECGNTCLAVHEGRFSFQGGVRLAGLNLTPLADAAIRPDERFFRLFAFTRRELEVIDRMLRGQAIPEIAAGLGISENTVKGYMHGVYTKTGTGGRKEFFALVRGYLPFPTGSGSLLHSLLTSVLEG